MATPSDNSLPTTGPGTGPYASWRHSQTVRAGCAARMAEDGSAGAQSSNTAPAKYIHTSQEAQVLAVGIDSLYLSFPGDLRPSMASELGSLKLAAQSPDRSVSNSAQIKLAGTLFSVNPYGKKGFAYVLNSNFFHIRISQVGNSTRPLALVKIGSHLLWQRDLEKILSQVTSVVRALGDSSGTPWIHRVDVCMDFCTDFNIRRIEDADWSCRSISVDKHLRGKVSGWSFGIKGDISARVYDKTLEITNSNKEFFKKIWTQRGWDQLSDVWRLEYQFERPFLKRAKIQDTDDLLRHMVSLWSYSTEHWLRLLLHDSSDSNRSRRPTSPLWKNLQKIPAPSDFEQKEIDLSIKTSAPRLSWLFNQFFGVLTSYMALREIEDPEAALMSFLREVENYYNFKNDAETPIFPTLLKERVHEKYRRFNIKLNRVEPDE